MKLIVTASLNGPLNATKTVEVEIDAEDYTDDGSPDGVVSPAAVEEYARDILFQRLISWDWKTQR